MPTETPPGLLEGRFEGRKAFEQLVRDALATAAVEGWREIILSDASFADWPLGERAVDASLRAWSKTGRKITLLAKNYDDLKARHHRFVTWRRDWSHIIEPRAVASADALDIPSAIWSPGWVLQRLDPVHGVGVAGSEPARRVALREHLHEWVGKSSASFPAVTAGL
jgi:hypothetical protein